jgi:hypothetical protein
MSSNSALVQRVVERAMSDQAFRAHLMANPRAAVENELGISIPADLTIRVVEERPTEFYIVLPPKEHSGELSDEALAGVAGGASSTWGPNCHNC